ncbi:MAG: Endonuclease III, partial [uncultured Nocardioidaceae bacterium]
ARREPRPSRPEDLPGAGRRLPRRPLRARLPQPVRAARGHGAQRADHRQARQPRDSRPVRRLPRPAGARRRGPGNRRGDRAADRVLPRQDRCAAEAGPGARREVRRPGARPAGGPRHFAWSGPQDGQRRPRRRVRHPGHHRGHPLRPARPALRLDHGDRRGEGRARHRRALPGPRLDAAQPPADLPRPALLPRTETGLWRLSGRPLVPVVRRGTDRPDRGRRARAHRGPRV